MKLQESLEQQRKDAESHYTYTLKGNQQLNGVPL